MPRYSFAPLGPDYPAAVSVAHFVSAVLTLLSKAGMSVSPARHMSWESGLGLGDDERARPATGSGAEPGDEWPAHHHLGRHGSGNQHPAGAPAPEGLPPGWRRCHRAQGPRPALEQQAGG